jgi:predicted phage baseplate assembly protein
VQVVFGDGLRGARLPAGRGNVSALYRVGIGPEGNVDAGTIAQLITRPLGVRGVTNPLSASGGVGPDGVGRTRRRASVGLSALDRLVSISDYADFALAFAGIAKAKAARVVAGPVPKVVVTVAAEDDASLTPDSPLVKNLSAAFVRQGDPSVPVAVFPRDLRLIVLDAELRIDPDRVFDDVAAVARARLLDRFGFDHRALGEDLVVSSVVASIQDVPGVASVRIKAIGLIDGSQPDGLRTPEQLGRDIQAITRASAGGIPPILRVGPPIHSGQAVGKEGRPSVLAYFSSDPNATKTLILREVSS